MNVLVLGGYGHFGALLSGALSRIAALRVTVAGRDLARAQACAKPLGALALQVDVEAPDLAQAIRAAGAELVVSTVGPFQSRDYRVPRAALAAGAHYVDIADARAFVCGIKALDAEARAAGRLVAPGASSVPALSGAVVAHFRAQFARLDAIDIAISSSADVPGNATLAAVLGYCGKPVQRWNDGEWRTTYGATDLRRHRFGSPPIDRWIGDGDVPDLELLPERYPGLRGVRFGAGVELAPVQWGVRCIAGLVRAGLVRDASRWTRALAGLARLAQPLGSGRSAMFVRMEGSDASGRELVRQWEICAEGGDGRAIPCAPAIALARKLAGGGLEARGATPAAGLVTLEECMRELEGWRVNAHECH
jgi:saccharopine dehydrogenase-like NADP-dependent oxidoreductase